MQPPIFTYPICGGLRGRTGLARSPITTVVIYELPLPATKLRSIFHFRVGAHFLPVEQGRIEMPKVPRHLRRCTFCATTAIGDERHCVFDCPHFQGLRQQHAEIFRDSHDAMRSVMWHKDQKSVCALVLAIVNGGGGGNSLRPYSQQRPMRTNLS